MDAPNVRTPLLQPSRSTSHHRPTLSSVRIACALAAAVVLLLTYLVSSSSPRTSTHDHPSLAGKMRPPPVKTLPATAARVQNQTGGVVFAAIGDWGRLGKFGQRETGVGMAAALPPNAQAIVSAGDNFYDYGVTSLSDPLFRESFEDVYTVDVLQTLPWYVVLGNHDYRGSVRAQIDYSKRSRRWNMPARYFSLWLSEDLMGVFVDTTPLSSSEEGAKARANPEVNVPHQLTWLNNTLRSAPLACRFVVVGHHNMYSSSVADHLGDSGVRTTLEPILAPFAARVVAYIAGHEHALMHMQPYANGSTADSGYDHFVTGAGSKLRPIVAPSTGRAAYWRECCSVLAPAPTTAAPRTAWSASVNGFFMFRIDGDHFSATAYDKDANVLHRHERTLPPVAP